MKRRQGRGKRTEKRKQRKPDRQPSLLDWLPVFRIVLTIARLIIEWLLH